MDPADVLTMFRAGRDAVLATLRRNGTPQLSTISYHVASDDELWVSVTDDRAKTRNLRRNPQAVLHVVGADRWSYGVLECRAELGAVTVAADDDAADDLVAYYRAMRGEHPDWAEYRSAMVADRRLLLRLHPTRAYGADLRRGG